MTATYVRTL